MCGGAGTVICGEPRVAAECRCTEREFGWCARPTVRPGRTVHDDRDHGDGSDTRPRGRRTNGSLTETSVRDWPYWRERFDGSADRHMNPGPLDGTDPGPGTSSPRASSQTDRSTPMAIRPWSSMRRATRPSCPVVRRRGRGTRPPGRSCDGRDAAGARGPLSHDPDVVLAGQRSRGQGWDRVIGAVSSHLRAARASLLRNAPSRSRHRRRLVGRAGGLSSSVGAWQTWPRRAPPRATMDIDFPRDHEPRRLVVSPLRRALPRCRRSPGPTRPDGVRRRDPAVVPRLRFSRRPPAHASTGPAGRHLAPRQGQVWFVRYGPVDATLVDRPPRGWARASREPAMLGTNNGRRPQLDTTVRSHQRGIGRHRPTDAVAACPKHVGVQGESCLQPQRLADTPQRVGVVGASGPAVGEALLRRQIGVFGEDPSGPLGRPPQAVDLSDGAGNGRHQRSTPHRSVSERSTRATVERQPAAERLVIGDVCGPTVRGSHRGVQGVVASPAAASRAAPRPPRVSQAPHASVSES